MAETRLRTNLEATVEVVSPLHVGAGRGPLLADYDFAFERGIVWVIDQRKLAEGFSDEELRHGTPDVRLSRRLGPGRYADCASYSLPAAGSVANEILPCIKSVEGLPYLPGSSLKGALRTVLVSAASREEGLAPRPGELGLNQKYAAAAWERRLFGQSPNYDLGRGLLVDDSGPAPLERLGLARVTVYSLRGPELLSKGQGYSFHLETLRPGTVLGCRIGIGEEVLSHPKLGLLEKRRWIDDLPRLARERALELISGERAFYAGAGVRPLEQFYAQLAQLASDLAPDQFLLQMAWGTGWGAKTAGGALAEGGLLEDARARYRLGRQGAPFPKSRRLVEEGGAPSAPLGWVKVTL